MISFFKALARIIEKTSMVMGYLAGVWVVIMTLVLFYSVVSRRVFNRPLVWDIDFTEIAMVVMVYLGVAYTTQIDGHVAMDAVYQRLSPRGQARVRVFVDIVVVVFAAVALWLGWSQAADFLRRWPLTAAATLPIAPAVVLIPVGMGLLLLQALVLLVRHTSKLFQSQETAGPTGPAYETR